MRCARGIAVVYAMFAAGAAQACAYAGDLGGQAHMAYCPASVTDYAERAVECRNLDAEMNGDDPVRDAQLLIQMDGLNCGALSGDKALLMKQYAKNKAVLEALETLAVRFGVE